MGTTVAPVAGSASCPAWMARVAKPWRDASSAMVGLLGAAAGTLVVIASRPANPSAASAIRKAKLLPGRSSTARWEARPPGDRRRGQQRFDLHVVEERHPDARERHGRMHHPVGRHAA